MNRKYWSVIVLTIIVIAIGIYLRAQMELVQALYNVSYQTIFYLIIFRFMFLVTNGLFLKTFAAKFGIHLAFREWIGIPIVTTMGNYLTPFSGGMVARAAYLKHCYNFPYAQFGTLLASNYLITFWTIGVVGLVTLLNFVEQINYYWQVIFLFCAVTAGITILILVPSLRLPGNYRLIIILNSALEGWGLIKGDWLLLVRLVVYTLVNILLNGLSFWIAYQALGYTVSFVASLLVGLLAAFSLFLHITPGNFGVQEAVVGLSSALLNIGAGQGVLASILVRAATVVVVFTLGPVFSYFFSQELTTTKFSEG